MSIDNISIFPSSSNITIFVESENGTRITGHIIRDCYIKSIQASMPCEQLVGFGESLRTEFCTLLQRIVSGSITSRDWIEGELTRIRDIGATICEGLFGSGEVREEVECAINASPTPVIHITSRGFSLPWELLWCKGLNVKPGFDDFWAAKAIIIRVKEIKRHPNEIAYKTLPLVKLFPLMRLPGVRNHEIPHLKLLQQQNQILLHQWTPISDNWSDNKLQFKSFWKDESFNLAHFACHASIGNGNTDTCLTIDDNLKVPLFQLVRSVGRSDSIENQPLVIFNACKTGEIDPMLNVGFVDTFFQLGVRGVIATECLVPDKAAHLFTEMFYKHFLPAEPAKRMSRGLNLGETIFKTRRSLWEEKSNPIGLLYSVYAHPGFHLVQQF